jgi:hypothetical protein
MQTIGVCQQIILSSTSPASATTVAGTFATGDATDPGSQPLAGYSSLRIEGTIQGATGGNLDVYLQCSYDNGTSWSDLVHFAQKTAGAGAVVYGVTLSRAQGDALATIGKGTSPALGSGTARAGCWGNAIRILYVAGSSTSAGATQTVKLFLSA